jgi:hypothetical protein
MIARLLCCVALVLTLAAPAEAHHVLGRPAYGYSGDSTTPSSAQMETQVGSYFVTMMAYPGILRPGEPGRIKFYGMHMDSGERLQVPVTFTVGDDSWLSTREEKLGTQDPVDLVYTQDIQFSEAGDYLVAAVFQAGGEPYRVEFAIRVGNPVPWTTLGLAAGLIAAALAGAAFFQQRRSRGGA